MDDAYRFKACDKFGKVTTGAVKAADEAAVAAKIRADGNTPVSIELVEKEVVSGFFNRFRRLKPSDLNAFTRELYTLTKAGLTILASLEVIAEQDRNPLLREIVNGLITNIRGGATISESLARYPQTFSPLYINMISAGEASGRLEQILERLIYIGEAEEKVGMRVKAALRYPMIVFIAMVVAFLVLTNFIIPRFAQLFAQSGVELPLPTRILLGIQYVTSHFWLPVLIVLALLVYGFFRIIHTKRGGLWWDRWMLKFPVFGPLILKADMSRFARIMAMLIQSGIPALRALEIAYGSAQNRVVANAIDAIRVSVTDGSGMTQPMRESKIFPPSVVRMVRVGEETGKIDELLLKVSEYYDMQVEYTVSNLTTLIEPMLIVMLGGMVLVLALGMFLPMWNMIKVFQH